MTFHGSRQRRGKDAMKEDAGVSDNSYIVRLVIFRM
jgi:hypothetical protein